MYALHGQFLPCLLHGIGGKKELARCELLGHGGYRLSVSGFAFHAFIIPDRQYDNLDFNAGRRIFVLRGVESTVYHPQKSVQKS